MAIVNGASRSDGEQLGNYCSRNYASADPTENCRILRLDSPWLVALDARTPEDIAAQLVPTFRDWEIMGEATKGQKALYHAQVSPAPAYCHEMTDAQWLRCADILAEELGFTNQPCAVIWQDKGEGDRPHIHVVWPRVDAETMKMIEDGWNYVAHERASMRMELEFGHELVAGKHAKRDRENQPEFPRAGADKDDYEQAARTGMSVEERKEQITALRAQADNAVAFKNLLEEEGYILARGDRRGFALVDQDGEIYSLSKQVTDIKGKEYKAFMSGLDPATLPTVDEARAQLEQHARAIQDKKREEGEKQPAETTAPEPSHRDPEKAPQDVEPEAIKKTREDRKPQPVDPERKQQIVALRAWADGAQAFKKALEEAGYILARGNTGYVLFSEDGVFSLARHAGLSKAKLDAFMSPIPPDSLPTVDALIEAQKQGLHESIFSPPQPEPTPPPPLPAQDTDLATRMEISALDMAAQVIADAQQARERTELNALQKALTKRQEAEEAALRERHAAELRAKEVELDRLNARSMENYTLIQNEQTEAFLKARQEELTGFKAIMRAIENRWNPTLAAERKKESDRELQNFYRRLAKERADYEALILQNKQLEIENLIERQALKMNDVERQHEEETERHIREYHAAQRLLAELEEDRRKQEELDHNDFLRDGPPPPKLGKT